MSDYRNLKKKSEMKQFLAVKTQLNGTCAESVPQSYGNKKDARLTMLPIVYSKLSCMYVHNCTGVHTVMHNFTLHILLYTLLYTTTGCIDKPRAPFKSHYIQQYGLKSHQAWCQMKALVLYFLGMSLFIDTGC